MITVTLAIDVNQCSILEGLKAQIWSLYFR